MARNKHELKKNLDECITNRERWYAALSDSTAPFLLKNQAFAHVRELDRRMQNLQWLLDVER